MGQGDALVMKTDSTQKIYKQMNRHGRQESLTQDMFIDYFVNQGTSPRKAKKMFKRFDPASYGKVSFKDFNELVMSIAAINGQIHKKKSDSPHRKKIQGMYDETFGFPIKNRHDHEINNLGDGMHTRKHS